MTYTLIGTGNIAWLVASRMQDAGHSCAGVWGRNEAATQELCASFSLPQMNSTDDLHDGPDACIVAVADTGIADVIRSMNFRHTTLIHTAGSVSIDVVATHSTHAGVVWPVYSIRKASLPEHREFPTLIESNTPEGDAIVRKVAAAISDITYEASSSQRQWLHLAAVMSNNFVNQLLATATDICEKHDMPARLLQPLIAQTVALAMTQHPSLLQTGPARRHDTKTLEQHLSMLSDNSDWQNIYQSLSKAIMARYPKPARE